MEQEQPTRIERRLAAIVAADVAGYSRLMGVDEVGTARTLREHFSEFLKPMTGLSLGAAHAIAEKFPWADYKGPAATSR
jgi:hypothetical protein